MSLKIITEYEYIPLKKSLLFLYGAIVSLFLSVTSGFSADYYVSSSDTERHDDNPGTDPDYPWATLAKVNSFQFEPGDHIYFKKGDLWRGKLVLNSDGAQTGDIVYSAYGTGTNPAILYSSSRDSASDWYLYKKNIWATDFSRNIEIGNMIFNGTDAGYRVWKISGITDAKANTFFYNKKNGVLYLYSTTNPAYVYSSIECAKDDHIIKIYGKNHITIENLKLKYGAAHGIKTVDSRNITIRNCQISFIGGGVQRDNDTNHVRWGNGIEFYAGTDSCLVENCLIYECFDDGLTNQYNGKRGTSGKVQSNITYRNNVIRNCEISFSIWCRPSTSIMRDIEFVNNTCINAGYGWGHYQRKQADGHHVRVGTNTALSSNILISNNIFCESKDGGIFWRREEDVGDILLRNNCWYEDEENNPIYAKILRNINYQRSYKSFNDYTSSLKYNDSTFQDENSVCKFPLDSEAHYGASSFYVFKESDFDIFDNRKNWQLILDEF